MFCYIVLGFIFVGEALSQTELSSADKQTTLDEHNRLRGMVSPTAANMLRMVSLRVITCPVSAAVINNQFLIQCIKANILCFLIMPL